jgi:hypothetical protein
MTEQSPSITGRAGAPGTLNPERGEGNMNGDLKAHIAKIDNRVSDIESFIRFLKPGTAITIFSLAAALIYLAPKYASIKGFNDQVQHSIQEVNSLDGQLNGNDGKGGLGGEVRDLRQYINQLRDQAQLIGTHQSESVLVARVKSFSTAPLPQPYRWNDNYIPSLEALNNLAVEYAALWPNLDKQASDEIFKALTDASKTVENGAKTMTDDGDATSHKGHLTALADYRNIVEKLHRGDGVGKAGEKAMCYQAAFPAWIGQVGVYSGKTATSAKCHEVIGL